MTLPKFREVEWRDPNHQKIKTGHTAFDRQTTLITWGNIFSSTIHGSFIRRHSETECNHHTHQPGYLRDFDLRPFKNLPPHVRRWFKQNPERYVILYELFHYRGDEKIVHGYVITEAETYRLVFKWDSGRPKSRAVVDECITYLTPLEEQPAQA